MKRNIIYILLITILLLVIVSLVLVIVNLYNRTKTPTPIAVSQPVVSKPQTVDFSRYGITPREAMYYE